MGMRQLMHGFCSQCGERDSDCYCPKDADRAEREARAAVERTLKQSPATRPPAAFNDRTIAQAAGMLYRFGKRYGLTHREVMELVLQNLATVERE